MPAEPARADLQGLTDRHALMRAAALLLPGDTPRLDAELLLAHALGVGRLEMLVGSGPVPPEGLELFGALIARRCTHEPIAHIVGEREFWSLPLKVTRDVLVPRPDSETLVAEALSRRSGSPPAAILDLGTGSGALLLAALSEWPAAVGVGVDCSASAIGVARANAAALGLGARAYFVVGDWAGAIDARFDLVFCNPPYIPEGTPLMPDVALHEPASALFGGFDGLEPYRNLFRQVPRLLAEEGVALFEFGEGQADALLAMAGQAGLEGQIAEDLAGRPRAIALRVAETLPMGLGKLPGSV